jgi:5'/3'-nucleotidase SurE
MKQNRINMNQDFKLLSGCIVTNDDGETPLLETTISIVKTLAEKCVIVIPTKNRTGSSSSITLNSPIEIEEFHTDNGLKRIKVSTYPSDGIRYTLKDNEDDIKIIFSGINDGYNIGYSSVNSGTVGAAREGLRVGLNGIALSTQHGTTHLTENWVNNVKDLLKKLISINEIFEYGPVIININIPNSLKNDKPEGIILPVSKVYYNEWYEYEHKGNKKILILRGDKMISDPNISDLQSLEEGKFVLNIIGTPWTKNYERVKNAIEKCISVHFLA